MADWKEQITSIITELKYYVYDISYVQEDGENILRIMIDNDTHISLDDCVAVSDAVNVYLDEADPFPDAYNLEVSSAGAEHDLRNEAEIRRAVGKLVYLETFDQHLTGKLLSYKNGFLEVEVDKKNTTKINEMDLNKIRLTIG